MADNFRIKTPHAAILIWNYIDRIGNEGVQDLNDTEKTMISTLSCASIQTNKTKAQPEGQFQLVLAPFKNWVSTITAGSWCCIMMSNDPITEEDLKTGNKKLIKMVGKIESVRVDTQMQDDGTRKTLYHVTGVDWGHIFNNTIYVDNLIAAANDPVAQGNALAVALRNILFGKDGTPKSFAVKDNLRSLINIFGQSTPFTQTGTDINRLANAVYNFNMPRDMVGFLQLKGPSGNRTRDIRLNKVLNLITGTLRGQDRYEDTVEAQGYINPFSLQGQHSFWQILLENSNPALNEMFCEMRFDEDDDSDGMAFTLFNRIKPFSYKDFNPQAGKPAGLKSYFQYIRRHDIDNPTVISINAGTNWRDKYNFIELKPDFQDFNVIANWYKQKSQAFDARAFEREGFRPMIASTRQFPTKPGTTGMPDNVQADWNQLIVWAELMKEWYFDTHRTLNGTMILHGITDYIAVGDNIRFDAGLINPTPNINQDTVKKQVNQLILAHVESVAHSFTVVPETGARTYTTTIQFVRGIIVNGDNIRAGKGILDKYATSVTTAQDKNTTNVNSTSDASDPDPQKVKGN